MMGKAACFTSLALIIHATVCAVQHREYLKAVQQPFSFPPFEISIQCIAAVLLGTWGVAHGSVDAARLCRCIRSAVQESVTATGSSVGVTAEPVSQGWTASGWEGADELRLLRKDGSLIAALAQGGDARREWRGYAERPLRGGGGPASLDSLEALTEQN